MQAGKKRGKERGKQVGCGEGSREGGTQEEWDVRGERDKWEGSKEERRQRDAKGERDGNEEEKKNLGKVIKGTMQIIQWINTIGKTIQERMRDNELRKIKESIILFT